MLDSGFTALTASAEVAEVDVCEWREIETKGFRDKLSPVISGCDCGLEPWGIREKKLRTKVETSFPLLKVRRPLGLREEEISSEDVETLTPFWSDGNKKGRYEVSCSIVCLKFQELVVNKNTPYRYTHQT